MKNLASFMLLSLPLFAGACNMGQIKIEDAYVRAMPQGQKNTAAYMVIENQCDQAMQLISVSSPVAGKMELHDVSIEEGVAKMHRIETLDLPAKEAMKLAPGGKHLMLLDVTQVLKPGSSVPLTLTFKEGGQKTFAVPVKDMRKAIEHQH